MTSEEWIANIPSEQDRKYAREAVNAALEKEREGEVVLGKGKFYSVKINMMNHNDGIDHVKIIASNNPGSLIFRPDTKEEK